MSVAPLHGVVIVTHNHEATIEPTLDSLVSQSSPPARIIVVDGASHDRSWMDRWRGRHGIELNALGRNVGFSVGNNIGWRSLGPMRDGWVLFLNPDIVAPPDLLERLVRVAGEERCDGFGALGPRLVSWDFGRCTARGAIDSTGIFPTLWGGWRDRREDSPVANDRIEEVPALCGAFLLARVAAMQEVARAGDEIWDERYFAYKEDIELSLRLRRRGWRVGLWHGGEAGHGRGWSSRRAMPRAARLLSARNEIRLHREYAPGRLPFSLLKYLAVSCLNL